MSEIVDNWRHYYTAGDSTSLGWPSETLVRLFRGRYIADMPRELKGMSVLEVGVGNGNNSVFMASAGLKVSGTEVHQDICDTARANLARFGVDADVRVGFNSSLPFADDSFDFLVSWNVLHYENSEDGIVAGIREYARVLKPGGRLLLSTTGPGHMVIADAQPLGHHRYQLGAAAGFRQGSIQFFFDHPNYIRHYFGASFAEVMVGHIHDELFTGTLDWFLVTGRKPA
jgi:SAM-dependent methyltransferase